MLPSCVADTSGPPLPASLLVVSGMPGASPVDQGRAWGAGHRIGSRQMDRPFGGAQLETKKLSSAPQIPLEDALVDAAGDALTN
jgi:hypothetical protein